MERVLIGKNHRQLSFAPRFFGVWLVYLPLLTLPFVLLIAYRVYGHLRMMGAEDVRLLSAYLLARKSYRYTLLNQITMQRRPQDRDNPIWNEHADFAKKTNEQASSR